MLLRDLYQSGRVRLIEGPIDWRTALRESVVPLVADGSVEPCYADELVANVERYGPYIVLVPGLAMPHAGEGACGVHRSAVSFMRVDRPVRFDEGHEAQVFFTFADLDAQAHLANMRRLYEVISRPEAVDMLAAVERPEDLLRVDAALVKG